MHTDQSFKSYSAAYEARESFGGRWQKPKSSGKMYFSPESATEKGYSPARGCQKFKKYILVHTSSLDGWIGQRSAAYISIWGK